MARPPKYERDPSTLPKILDVLRRGGSFAEAAKAGGVAELTLSTWRSSDPEVDRQIGEARATAGAQPAPPPKPTPREADRWGQVALDAAKLGGPGLFGYLLWLEAKIPIFNERQRREIDKLPPMPRFWLDIYQKFWASGKRELLVLGGRNGGKSTMGCRPALVEYVFAAPVTHGGEVAVWAEMAQDMSTANLMSGVSMKLLEAVGYAPGGDPHEGGARRIGGNTKDGRSTIEIVGAHGDRVDVRVLPATVGAVSGPSLKGARHDEEQKWRKSAKDDTSSAEDVLEAIGGAMREPHVHLIRVSTPYSLTSPHHLDVHAGDTRTRMVATIGDDYIEAARAGFERYASHESTPPNDARTVRSFASSLSPSSPYVPTWVMHPRKDPIELIARNVGNWLQEYGAQSTQEGQSGDAFDAITIDAALVRARPSREPDEVFAAIDTGAKKNPAALAIVGRWVEVDDDGTERATYAPLLLRTWKPSPGRPLDLRLVVLPEMARLTIARGAWTWSADGWASDQVELVAAGHGIDVSYVATSEAWRDEYGPVANGLARGEVCLAGCDRIDEAVRQLRRVSTRSEVGAQGPRVKVLVPEDASGEHGDLAGALVRALAAAGCGKVEEARDANVIGAIAGRYSGDDPRGHKGGWLIV